MASKRKASAMANAATEEPVDPADELKFLCLGGGNEVGRSCHIIQYKGKTVMVSMHILLPNRPSGDAELRCSLMPASTRPTMGFLLYHSSISSTSALSTYSSSASKFLNPFESGWAHVWVDSLGHGPGLSCAASSPWAPWLSWYRRFFVHVYQCIQRSIQSTTIDQP